ncbi:uncharacterized protein LOC144099051 [Amblyomma americanum]
MDPEQPSTSYSTTMSGRDGSVDDSFAPDLSSGDASPTYGIAVQPKIPENVRPAGDITTYCCDSCDKDFHLPSKLIAHIVYRHERYGARPYARRAACFLCQAPCKSRAAMVLHMGSHLGERCCKKCGAEFACAATEAAHKHFHKTGGYFMCGFCEKLFARKGDREEHTKLEHPQRPLNRPRSPAIE